jgi:hypothetical protein
VQQAQPEAPHFVDREVALLGSGVIVGVVRAQTCEFVAQNFARQRKRWVVAGKFRLGGAGAEVMGVTRLRVRQMRFLLNAANARERFGEAVRQGGVVVELPETR